MFSKKNDLSGKKQATSGNVSGKTGKGGGSKRDQGRPAAEELISDKKELRKMQRAKAQAEVTAQKPGALDDKLKASVTEYNAVYASFNDHGTKLFNQRERALDLLQNIENLINSIARHPKSFYADIAEIRVKKKEFRDVCDYAREELTAAQKSAVRTGAGVADGLAVTVTSLAPGAAM